MDKHLTLLGALYIAFGALGILIAFFLAVAVTGAGLVSGDEDAIAITGFVGAAVACFILLFSIPAIIGGIGLLQRKPWARILILVLGCLNLINIPLGTVLGIYTIWVLFKEETSPLFSPPQPEEPAPPEE